jgi:peroxiredoxin
MASRQVAGLREQAIDTLVADALHAPVCTVSRGLRSETLTGSRLVGSYVMGDTRWFRFSIGRALAALAIAVLAATAYMTLGRTETVPDATFTLMSGQKLTTADLRGKVYLVHFWATSCATCIKEMPQMIQTYDRFRGEHFDFVAVAMSYDPLSYVTNYTETHHLPFKVVMDTDGHLPGSFITYNSPRLRI